MNKQLWISGKYGRYEILPESPPSFTLFHNGNIFYPEGERKPLDKKLSYTKSIFFKIRKSLKLSEVLEAISKISPDILAFKVKIDAKKLEIEILLYKKASIMDWHLKDLTFRALHGRQALKRKMNEKLLARKERFL